MQKLRENDPEKYARVTGSIPAGLQQSTAGAGGSAASTAAARYQETMSLAQQESGTDARSALTSLLEKAMSTS